MLGIGVCTGIQVWSHLSLVKGKKKREQRFAFRFNILLTLIQSFRHKIKDDSIHFVIKIFGTSLCVFVFVCLVFIRELLRIDVGVVLLCVGTMMVYRQVIELHPGYVLCY